MREKSSEAFVFDDPLTIVNRTHLRIIRERAQSNLRRRSRILLHGDSQQVLQEMVIVMTHGQYVPPHLNVRSEKTLIMFQGKCVLIRFDTNGNVTSFTEMAAASGPDPFIARMHAPVWHMVIPVSAELVFLERVLGPHQSTTFAAWAPPANAGQAATLYFKQICERCGIPDLEKQSPS